MNKCYKFWFAWIDQKCWTNFGWAKLYLRVGRYRYRYLKRFEVYRRRKNCHCHFNTWSRILSHSPEPTENRPAPQNCNSKFYDSRISLSVCSCLAARSRRRGRRHAVSEPPVAAPPPHPAHIMDHCQPDQRISGSVRIRIILSPRESIPSQFGFAFTSTRYITKLPGTNPHESVAKFYK